MLDVLDVLDVLDEDDHHLLITRRSCKKITIMFNNATMVIRVCEVIAMSPSFHVATLLDDNNGHPATS